MSKTEFKSLRQHAIKSAKEWQSWHMAQMESALDLDHTATANDQLTYANRAEKCVKWLQSANRQRFNKWYQTYLKTGSMIVNEGQQT